MPDEKHPGEPGPGEPGAPRRAPARGLVPWALAFLVAILVLTVFSRWTDGRINTVSMPRLRTMIDRNEVVRIVLRQDQIVAETREVERGASGARPHKVRVPILEPQIKTFEDFLVEHNERIGRLEGEGSAHIVEYSSDRGNEMIQALLINLLPWVVLFIVFWYLISRQFRMQGGAGSVFSFGKSRARMHTSEQVHITFDDVAGVDEAKEEVQEIVEFLRNPRKFSRLGGRIPRGVLLVGSPGTGKTLLAKAIAGEAKVPFFSISGSDFVEMFVGVGAARVRDLFRDAKEHAPAIIFLDEIDAVGRRRGAGIGGGHDEREQTLNAILVEMDGFERDSSVIVVAATNRPDVLDTALRRPGRFDRTVVVDLPDMRGREAILRVHARNYKLAPSADLKQLARGTPMFSGADLEAIMNEAALMATRAGKDMIEMDDFEQARDKVRWGREKRSRVMDDKDRRITAYHEGGHAIVAMLLPEIEPLHKVSIISQGVALGMTMSLPEKDIYHVQRKRLLGQICLCMGGRAAEEEFCDDISTGAAADLEQATDMARSMVCRWGMSAALGPISYHEEEDTIFLAREITRTRTHSEAVAVKIDQEVRAILTDAYERARRIVQENRDSVQRITDNLLRYEVLYRKDVERIMAGEDISGDHPNRRSPTSAAEEEPPPGTDDEAEPREDSPK